MTQICRIAPPFQDGAIRCYHDRSVLVLVEVHTLEVYDYKTFGSIVKELSYSDLGILFWIIASGRLAAFASPASFMI